MRAFFDTNVLLDVILERPPHYQNSARAWTRAERGAIEGYVSAVSFTDIFYIVQRVRNGAEARSVVRGMLGVFTPATCNAGIVRQAVESDLPDFEDAVQYFSALHAEADCIITRNAPDFPRRPALPVLSPAQFLAQLEAE